MTDTSTRHQNRRDMLRSTLRHLALGTICLASGGLVARHLGRSAGVGCDRLPSCAGCAALTHCRLPRALAAKRQQQR